MFANTNAASRKRFQAQLSKCVSAWERAQIKPLNEFKTSVSFGQRTDFDSAADASVAKCDRLQRGGGGRGGAGGRDSSDMSTSSSLCMDSTKQSIAASVQACPSVVSGILHVSEIDIQEEGGESPCKM